MYHDFELNALDCTPGACSVTRWMATTKLAISQSKWSRSWLIEPVWNGRHAKAQAESLRIEGAERVFLTGKWSLRCFRLRSKYSSDFAAVARTALEDNCARTHTVFQYFGEQRRYLTRRGTDAAYVCLLG
jgi:hypothetical protein